MSDADNDGILTIDEIISNHDLWVDSDATQFGQQLRFVHEEL